MHVNVLSVTTASSVLIQSVMLYCSVLGLSVKDKAKLYNQINICSKINGLPVAHLFQEAHNKSMLSTDVTHVLHREYQLLPSKRRFRVPSFKHNT